MKKLLSWALVASMALFATACSDDDNDGLPATEDGSYVGKVEVVKVTGDDQTPYTNDATSFSSEIGDGTISIKMNGVKFAEDMPPLVIEMRDIPMVSAGKYEAAALTPYYNGLEYPAFAMTNVEVECTTTELDVEFTCTAWGTTYDVDYDGFITNN